MGCIYFNIFLLVIKIYSSLKALNRSTHTTNRLLFSHTNHLFYILTIVPHIKIAKEKSADYLKISNISGNNCFDKKSSANLKDKNC